MGKINVAYDKIMTEKPTKKKLWKSKKLLLSRADALQKQRLHHIPCVTHITHL